MIASRIGIGALGAVALATVLVASVAAADPRSPNAAFVAGRVAYERGRYADAVVALRPLLYPTIELNSEESVVEAHRLLALAYLFQQQNAEAESEADALLALRPEYQADPVVDPPAAVQLFATVRHRQEERLARIRERQQLDAEKARLAEEQRLKDAHAKAERVYIERTIYHHDRFLAFLPFGAGQFQAHRTGLGVAFATSEIVFGAAWAGITLAINQKFPDNVVGPKDKNTANTLLALQVTAGTAFWATVIAGVLEAQIRFKSGDVVETRELPAGYRPTGTSPAAQPSRAPSQTAPAVKVSVAPIINPQLYGLSAQGTF